MRNNNLKTLSPYPSLLPALNFTPDFSTSSSLSSTGGWGMGVVVSWSLLQLPLHAVSLLQHGVPPKGDSP